MNVDALVARLVSDPGFAKAVTENPSNALRSAGIEATPEMLDALKGIDAGALQRLAVAFGKDKAAV